MAEVAEVPTTSATELLAAGRRHLAVREFTTASETLAQACEALAKEFGDTAYQCVEAYFWYGKALLGLSRQESGVLGDGVPGTGNVDEEDDDNEEEDNDEKEAAEENGEAEKEAGDAKANGEATSSGVERSEAESTTNEEAGSSSAKAKDEPGKSNDDDEMNVSMKDPDAEEDEEADVDNLQLAWEMLELARTIIISREEDGKAATRGLLADVYLALGEVALESETYDKAVSDMQSCLEIQKELYGSDDRRIAETHYQIGVANSLAANFEEAITHFKNAANILESRIKTLENPAANDDATVKKYSTSDPFYSIEGEIKELKELLPEIQEKIQDMMDYKAETIKRVRDSLMGTKSEASSNGASSSSAPKPAASDISHLIKRKRKASDASEQTDAKRVNT